ncbi:MAG TPA: glycosyltransferase [Longimicrobiales bacterium]|nr:glycosyltransferase [Longimicrobiales bacterium]
MSYRVRIVVPCYNEALRLDVAGLEAFLERAPEVAFTLVDDGSTDHTWRLLGELAGRSPGVERLRLTRNAGKAEAVRRGVLHAIALGDAPLLGYWDADFSTPLATILDMSDELEAHPSLMLLMASRVQLLGRSIERRPVRHYAGRVIATLAAATLGLRVYDTQCGAKLLRAGAEVAACFEAPFITRWMFDVELIARIVRGRSQERAAERIREYPLPVWRDVAGSKISTRAGLRALLDLARIRRHYYPVRSAS